jgi:hypothetical protein
MDTKTKTYKDKNLDLSATTGSGSFQGPSPYHRLCRWSLIIDLIKTNFAVDFHICILLELLHEFVNGVLGNLLQSMGEKVGIYNG